MRLRLLAIALACLMAGCVVGPDYRTPATATVDSYAPGPAPAAPGMPVLVAARSVSDTWWKAFGSPVLDDYVARALAASPTLDEARARVTQARELSNARTGATRYPQVDLTGSATRVGIDTSGGSLAQSLDPGAFNVFFLGVNLSYDFDVFGGTRRELEALAAHVDYRGYELEGARLTLAGSVVAAVVQRATAGAELEATRAILGVQRKELAIAVDRYGVGGIAQVALKSQEALVAQTEALVPPLRAEVALAEHRLAVLMGEPPATARLPAVTLADLRVPGEVPLVIPSELVRVRPDIRGSEALLRKASADVGVATADLYPRFAISGGLLAGRLTMADPFPTGFGLLNLGINLAQPLFRGGELKARQRAAEAAYEQALAAYRQTVLQSLQNVADVLRKLEADSATLDARTVHAARAEEIWQVTRRRHELGGVSELAVVDSQRQHLTAEVGRIAAQGARLANVAALYQALGGGVAGANAMASPEAAVVAGRQAK